MSEEKIFEDLKDVLVEHLGIERESVTMNSSLLDDLSADSLDLVEVVMSVEELYGMEIPEDTVEKFRTVKDVVDYIKENVN